MRDLHTWSDAALRNKLDEIAHYRLRGVDTLADRILANDIDREIARREFAGQRPSTFEQWAKENAKP